MKYSSSNSVIVLSLSIFVLTAFVSCQSDEVKPDETQSIIMTNSLKLTADDGAGYDFFGDSMAVSKDGGTIVIGATGDDDNGSTSGSIYVFQLENSNWIETKISASEGDFSDDFGASVAVSSDGDVIAVGADNDEANGEGAGSIYVYTRKNNIWLETKILAYDGEEMDNFGYSLDISDDGSVIIVGAPRDNNNGSSSGSVYVYVNEDGNWQETKITAADGERNDLFGYSVACVDDGALIAVGAPGDSDRGENAGAVYIYTYSETAWAGEKIKPFDGKSDSKFGKEVDISSDGSLLVVGAPENDDIWTNSGAVYTFRKKNNDWQESRVFANDLVDNSGFGISISVDENYLVVGAGEDSGNAFIQNKVYFYHWNGSEWVETPVVIPDNIESDMFGDSCGLSAESGLLMITAPLDDPNGESSGAAYGYDINF